jgi:outer membrane receptor protein involved in Fe transport
MKQLFTFITILIFSVTAKAQFVAPGGAPAIVGKISGTVIDSLTQKPLDYATVTLFGASKTPVTGGLTDDKGGFKLDNVKPGIYRIEVSFVGYPTKILNGVETTSAKPDKNLGNVVVAPSAKSLSEVNVTGTRALVENRIDKIVYNAEKDLTAAGGNATDVLQKVPLVSVDINGNVSLRGDQNVRVLINGKPSGATSANLADVLKTIPADQIKSIEVVTSPSAKYDAEGTAGILNIITKSKSVSGVSGSVSGGIGTRQNNGNFNINYNKNRFSLTANVGGNFGWPQTSTSALDQTFIAANTRQTSNSSNRVKRLGLIGSVGASYEFNEFNVVNTNIRLNQGGFNSDGSQLNTIYNLTNGNSSPYTGTSISKNSFGGFDWNADYTHKFKAPGHELSFSGQWSHSEVNADFTNIFSGVNPSQKTKNDGINNEYTFQTDYVNPISKLFKIEAGAKSILRRIGSNIINNMPSTTNPSGFEFNPATSYLYNYDQDVFAGYSVLTFTLPKDYTLMAGLRYENTDIKGNTQNSLVAIPAFTQNYNTFIPSFTIQKALTPTQTIKLSYSKRIARPSLTFLNPFLNKSNQQSQTIGNPTLLPEVSQTVEFSYNTFIGSSVINASTYYKYTDGLIEGIASPLTTGETGTLTQYLNIGTNRSFGGSIFGSVSLFKIFSLRANFNAFSYSPRAAGGLGNTVNQNAGTYIQYNGFLSGSVTTKSGFIAEVFSLMNSSRRTIQGENPSFSLLGLGVKQQILQKKATIGINVISPFSENRQFVQNISSPTIIQKNVTSFPLRSFGLTFSYSFGKTTFGGQKQSKGVNNDDLKQGEGDMQGGGDMGGAGGATGGAPAGGAGGRRPR